MINVATSFGVIPAESYPMDESFASNDALTFLTSRSPRPKREFSDKAAREARLAAKRDMEREGWIKRGDK